MPETRRIFSEICPACGDGVGMSVLGVRSAQPAIHLQCENCANRWSVIVMPGQSTAAISRAELNARLDAVIRLRPKLDRRSTPRS